jgi:hypothetical protein
MTRALNGWRMGVSYKSTMIPVSGTPCYQHLFDLRPLPEQELVLDPFRVIRKRKFVRKMLENLPNPGQERLSISSRNIDVHGGPVQHKFGRTGASGRVNINGVCPVQSRAFGSAPFFSGSSIKSRLVTLPE